MLHYVSFLNNYPLPKESKTHSPSQKRVTLLTGLFLLIEYY